MQNENGDKLDREQKTSILLSAPIELVWDVWTKPEPIKHGRDRTVLPIQLKKCKQKLEASGFLLCMDLLETIEHLDPNFIATIEFEPQGNSTFIK